MATYHTALKSYSRGQGTDPLRHLAYVTGAAIYDDRTGQCHVSGDRNRVAYSAILLPAFAPEWAQRLSQDTGAYWNARNHAEDRLNRRCRDTAAIYFEYVIALPRELTLEQNVALIQDLVQQTFHTQGVAVQASVHWDEGNPHVHLNVDDRPLTDAGWSKHKHRVYNRRDGLKVFRAKVAEVINTHYALHGIDERVTHLSHEERGLDLEATLHRGPRGSNATTVSENIAAENAAIHARNVERIQADVGIIVQEVSTRKNVFTEKDLATTLFQRLNGDQLLFEALYPQLLQHPDLIPLSIVGTTESLAGNRASKVYTTVAHQREEQTLLRVARQLSDASTHRLEEPVVRRIIEQGHRRSGTTAFAYTDEQAATIQGLTIGANLMQLHGRAGTGKTTVLKAVAAAYTHAGYRVIGMALSGVAAQNLGQEAGIDARTLHRWFLDWNLKDEHHATLATGAPDDTMFEAIMKDLTRLDPSQLTGRDVLIVDEASMVGTRQMQTLLGRAAKANAKVILVGDTAQLGAVDYGAPYRLLREQLSSDHHCTLTTVYRQREGWMQRASTRMHAQLAEGLMAYYERGYVTAMPTRHDAMEALTSQYLQGRLQAPERSHLALSATRANVVTLNHTIRRQLMEKGCLGACVPETTPAFGRDVRVNDTVVLTQNAPHLWVSTEGKVRDERELGRVFNGDRGTIQAIHVVAPGRVVCEVALERGGIALVDSAVYRQMEYGYAVTVHKSQGMTVDHSYVYLDKGFRQNTAYVALTRHRHSVQVRYDQETFKDYAALERYVSRSSYEGMIVDYSLSEGAQQIADRLTAYQTVTYAMADYRQTLRAAVSHASIGTRLYKDPTYRALKNEQAALALTLVEDWSPVHDRLCGQLRLDRQKLYRAAGIRTAYERERDQKVAFYCTRLKSLRQEADAHRQEMGAMPYRWDEPIPLRLTALQEERDRLAEHLLRYPELKTDIIAQGFRWSQLEQRAAREGYRLQRNRYYVELSETNRSRSREVHAFAQEHWVLGIQRQAMAQTHPEIERHMAYDGYLVRQQALNAQAERFVNTIEHYERMLVLEGIDLDALHLRAACHRIHATLTSGQTLPEMQGRVTHELELDDRLRDRQIQQTYGVALPEGWVAAYEKAPVAVRSVNRSVTATSGVPLQTPEISVLSAELRMAWDRVEALQLTKTMASAVSVSATQLREARLARDQAAARLIAHATDRHQTSFSEKQWAVIRGFAQAVVPSTLSSRMRQTAVPLEQVVQVLKDRMPEVCEALVGERPTQRKGTEWRYGSKGSLKVTVGGPKAGSFVNFETGEKGGPLQFIATQRQCHLPSAIDWARTFTGQTVDRTASIPKVNQPVHPVAPIARTAWSSQVPPQPCVTPDMTRLELKTMYHRNQETARYTYTDATGHPLFYVVRFEPKVPTDTGPTKMTLPLSYGVEVGTSHSPSWRFKKYVAPDGSKTPLYNLKALTDAPEKPVLIVEGEKAADAAKAMFPDMVVTTWQGGASAPHRTRWTELRDRTVVIWPDNDVAGHRAANQVKQQCDYAGAAQVAIVNLEMDPNTPAFPQKWDLADALPEGLTMENIQHKITHALSTLRTNVRIGLSMTTHEATAPAKTGDVGFELGD